ncbi:hypothetical protein LguiA_021813 [Lonicera macranthoides]
MRLNKAPKKKFKSQPRKVKFEDEWDPGVTNRRHGGEVGESRVRDNNMSSIKKKTPLNDPEEWHKIPIRLAWEIPSSKVTSECRKHVEHVELINSIVLDLSINSSPIDCGVFDYTEVRPSLSVGLRFSPSIFHVILRVQHSTALPSSTTLVLSPTTPFLRFRLLPVRSPILWESFLLSFPLATKMFQFAKLSLACPWIQQQFKSTNLWTAITSPSEVRLRFNRFEVRFKIRKSFTVAVTSMIDHGRAMIDHGSPEFPRDSKEGRLLPPIGEKALNRARENEVGDSTGGCVCPQRRAHSRYLAFQLDYMSLVRRVSSASGTGPVCHYFPNGESPGSNWATNGHHPLGDRLV